MDIRALRESVTPVLFLVISDSRQQRIMYYCNAQFYLLPTNRSSSFSGEEYLKRLASDIAEQDVSSISIVQPPPLLTEADSTGTWFRHDHGVEWTNIHYCKVALTLLLTRFPQFFSGEMGQPNQLL
jgi:hypothetical protein